MTVTLCPDESAATWLTQGSQPWRQLVCLGPIGLPAHARLRFIPDPTRPGESEGDVEPEGVDETEHLRTAAAVLTAYTTTPQRCFFALWDGWGLKPRTTPSARPNLRLPNRNYFLFEGAVGDLGVWREALWPMREGLFGSPDPAFVWPADRAWCLTNDVDTHYAGIGGSLAAIEELLAHPGLDVVRAELDEDTPHFV